MPSQEIHFSNGHLAQLATLPAGEPAASVIQALEIPKTQALILLLGGAKELEEALIPRLLQLLSRGLARVGCPSGGHDYRWRHAQRGHGPHGGSGLGRRTAGHPPGCGSGRESHLSGG